MLNIHSKVYVHMYTYVHSRPPLGCCTQARPGTDDPRKTGSLSQAAPASHSESNILPKEGGAGEKKEAGVWSVVTVAFISLSPPQRLEPSSPSRRGQALHPRPPGAGCCYCCCGGRACVCVCGSTGAGVRVRTRGPEPAAPTRPCVSSEGKREERKNENCKVRAG